MSDRPRSPRVLLLEIEIRTSERTGARWYSGWLGKARVVGFEGAELNARGHQVIQLFVEQPEPRDGDAHQRINKGRQPGQPPSADRTRGNAGRTDGG